MTIIEDLERRIKIIEDFQTMAEEIKAPMPITFIGGNARKREIKNLIRTIKRKDRDKWTK